MKANNATANPYLLMAVLAIGTISAHSGEQPFVEPRSTGSAFFLENDWLLHPVKLHQEDRNYTMGVSWQASGARVRDWWISRPFQWVDGWVGRQRGLRHLRLADDKALGYSHTLDVGVSAFTPDDLGIRDPIQDDRPYTSLLFVDVQRRALRLDGELALTTELSMGLYGLSLGKGFQRWVHRKTQGSDGTPVIPEGWDNQISDGGEPTFRYGVRAQRSLGCLKNFDAQVSAQGNVGYYTNMGAGAALRVGHIVSNWWQFDAKKILQDTVPMGAMAVHAASSRPISALNTGSTSRTETASSCEARPDSRWEAYVWAGGNITAWGYNGLLQGQFRHSNVRVSHDELERLVFDYTLGANLGLKTKNRWHLLSLAFSRRSPEADFGTRRSHQWGGIYYSTSKLPPPR
jgi:hypothetical protein